MGVWEKQLPLTSTIHEQSMIAVANQSLKRALIDRIMTNFVTILSLRRDRLHSRIAVKVKQTGGRRTPAIQNRSTQRQKSRKQELAAGCTESGWDGVHSHTAACTAPSPCLEAASLKYPCTAISAHHQPAHSKHR